MKNPSLLTIPREDDCGDETLILLQLPSGVDLESLSKAQIIGDSRASVVLPGRSFHLNRVETSNALVLIPPSTERPRKKLKTTRKDDQELEVVQTKLLGGGGTGAFFLELRETKLDVMKLKTLLQSHELNPYGDNHTLWSGGRTAASLALELQVSEAQVLNCLQSSNEDDQTFASVICVSGNYGVLAEEALSETQVEIVAALSEVDEFGDYAVNGIYPKAMVKEVTARMSDEEAYPELESVLHHTLDRMKGEKESDNDKIVLDFNQVARCVVHQLFRQPEWQESELLREWQARVPGVGDAYTVSTALLEGIALLHSDTTWKYFPVAQMSSNTVEERLDQCFKFQETWTRGQLQVYLQSLTDDMDVAIVGYAVPVEQDGVVKHFIKKQQ